MSGTKDFASPYSKPAPSHLEEDLPVGLSPSTNLQGPNWTSPDLDAPSLHPATSQTSPSTFAVDSRADGWPSNGFPFTALPHGETIFNAPASGVQTHNNLAGIDANALDWGDAGSSAVHQIDENANLYDRRGKCASAME